MEKLTFLEQYHFINYTLNKVKHNEIMNIIQTLNEQKINSILEKNITIDNYDNKEEEINTKIIQNNNLNIPSENEQLLNNNDVLNEEEIQEYSYNKLLKYCKKYKIHLGTNRNKNNIIHKLLEYNKINKINKYELEHLV